MPETTNVSRFRHMTLVHDGVRPDEYLLSARFEMTPSSLRSQACFRIAGPSPSRCSLYRIGPVAPPISPANAFFRSSSAQRLGRASSAKRIDAASLGAEFTALDYHP